jgi:hypothetical protein
MRGGRRHEHRKYMTMLAFAVKPKGMLVGLYEPIFVATKRDMGDLKAAAPVEREVGKLVKQIDALDAERSGKITNFTTGQTDPF